jgi:cell wall integrity and stress response component
MISRLSLAASWCALLSFASAGDTTDTVLVSTPTATPTGLRALIASGCYSTPVPMIYHGPYIYQSYGNCQQICYGFGNLVMGLGNGTDCWCGDELPPVNAKVDNSSCNTPCAGYGDNTCASFLRSFWWLTQTGGSGKDWTVFLTGYSLNSVANFDPSASSSSTITNGPTASATSTGKSGKSGSSAGGIAAGVIVAVLVVAAIFGGVLFYFRRKREQDNEIEEIHAKKDMSFASAASSGPSAAAQAGSGDRPGMWAPDSRMDSGTTQQRMSTGSIADNQDFSRRILEVCRPS